MLMEDFWQLDPPIGPPLSAIPTEYISRARQFTPSATTQHGQSLVWGAREHCGAVQGLTELTECVRCTDPWLRSVQEELRNGHLSEKTHQFLHGIPTAVPGSWLDGSPTCGLTQCVELVGKSSPEVLQKECRIRREERRTRKLVASEAADPRFSTEKFLRAKVIFPIMKSSIT
jgi:hypothetical protein